MRKAEAGSPSKSPGDSQSFLSLSRSLAGSFIRGDEEEKTILERDRTRTVTPTISKLSVFAYIQHPT